MFVLVMLAVALVCSEVAIGFEGRGCKAHDFGNHEECIRHCIS